MSGGRPPGSDAQTTPLGARTTCPQCGVQLDSFTTTCAACGAVVTGGTIDPARMERVRVRLQDGVGAGYRLGNLLGRGGMGIVFQAREVALDRDVALKVLAFDPILNPDAFDRFEREAKLAARLDHPNIVPIFSVGQGNGIAYYTMRMVRGGSVEALLAGGNPLDVPRALAILGDVASALDYAHGQGVVHRDIKPANVLLSDSGHAMVADFGIARAFTASASGGTSGTGTGVVGSPAYMSPEQWRGEKVDGRADQYALGVLAFELLTGVRPFSGDSMQELLRMHLQDDAPDVISVRHDLPPHLSDPIRRAMAKQPGERFASAGEFVAALGSSRPARGASERPPAAGAATIRTPSPSAPPRAPGAGTVQAPVRAPGREPVREPGREPGRETGREPSREPVREPAGVAAGPGERRSPWPWLVLLLIAGAGAAVIMKLAPDRSPPAVASEAPAPVAAPAASDPNADGLDELERRMQAQIDEARRIAQAAERRADSIAAANRGPAAGAGAGGLGPDPREVPRAHVYVLAQGGSAQVYVDGAAQNVSAPALVQVSPGRRTIRLRGATPFVPSDTTIEIAASDTQTIIFRSARLAQQSGGNTRGSGATRSGGGGAAGVGAGIENLPVNWDDWTRKLGFDPRTTDLRSLTPEQRQRYRRFAQAIDSLRRLAGRRP